MVYEFARYLWNDNKKSLGVQRYIFQGMKTFVKDKKMVAGEVFELKFSKVKDMLLYT
ncbi:hypothetical protein HanHA300_Chr06g0213401 [Helianthus annuus]|nr:hypothetical protein HanHA300_Chr06g0213401 [Helianthus annuus]KAJ0573658.1 hypothetical protein HanHA89_Chr06g0229181 [Helianthus annuus]KAJ0738015.1 hypothetical protein HanLR1_Chr06g0213341 [Helianthus annuus]